MPIIISNGAVSLSTASGFYRVEASNMTMFSTTQLGLSTTRTIAVTFANAGNCLGVVLNLSTATYFNTMAQHKPVTVKLQQNVASVWTDRASATLTGAQIGNDGANGQGTWIVPFVFSTGYAVTTAAATWRLEISQGAGTVNWDMKTSDGTNPFYAAWCDNAVTFTNGDTVIAKDLVTINQSATFGGVLGTGETTRSVCAIACSSTTPTTPERFQWVASPAAAYTLSLSGHLILAAHSGFRIGTAAARIPVAQRATVDFIAATVGTAALSGFTTPDYTNASGRQSMASLWMYGAVPANKVAILNAAAALSQANIVTTTSTGWAVNDRIVVGGNTVRGLGDATVYTISSISGQNITLNSNLITTARSANGRVIKLSGYGVEVLCSTITGGIVHYLGVHNNFTLSGVYSYNVLWRGVKISGNDLLADAPANTSVNTIEDCAFELIPSGSANLPIYNQAAFTILPNVRGMQVRRNVMFACGMVAMPGHTSVDSSLSVIDSNVCIRGGTAATQSSSVAVDFRGVFSNNVFEAHNGAALNFRGNSAEFANNRFWGISTFAVWLFENANCTITAHEYENNLYGLYLAGGATSELVDIGSRYGQEVANGTDMLPAAISYFSITVVSPVGSPSVGTASGMRDTLPGAILRMTNFGGTQNDDRSYMPYGTYQRTGSGLSDSTVRTAGGFALRLAPYFGDKLFVWPNLIRDRAVPTGNITGQTMTVSCWIYIGAAAYYAGVNIRPTLNVKFDNATTATSTAAAIAGVWQQIAVTFTPTTTFGQIDVWVSGATDAAGANAYFYIDDVSVSYPAGSSLNLGGLDLWANALPVWPPIATVRVLGTVWDELPAAHTIAGTYGKLFADRIDAAISSRLATAGYTVAPAAATVAGAVRTELATELARIDAPISGVAVVATGAAVSKRADSFVLTAGSVVAGTYLDTYDVGNGYHQITHASGAIDCYYETVIGADYAPVSATILGRMQGNSNTASVMAYNWDDATWRQVGVMAGKVSDVTVAVTLFVAHVGTGANAGKVRLRFLAAGVNNDLYIDQLWVSYAPVSAFAAADRASLAAIPTTPLLSADVRLDLLDVAVSSRATAATVLASLNATTIPVDVKKVNGVTIKGVGVPGDTWGPA